MMCFDPISYDKAEKARKHSENVQEQLNQAIDDLAQHKLDYSELNGVKKGAVTPDKTTFIKVSSNLFNSDKILKNTNISTTGEEVESTTRVASGFIPVKRNTTYSLTGISRRVYYDKDKNFLRFFDTGSSFSTGEDVYYVRLVVLNENVDIAQLNEGTVLLPYEKGYVKLDTDMVDIGDVKLRDGSVDVNKLSFVERSTNLIDKDSLLIGYALPTGDGEPYPSGQWSVTPFIPVDPSSPYIRDRAGDATNFYDENKNFIDRVHTKAFTTGANVKYVRLNIHKDRINVAQLNKGTTLLPYEPYYVRFTKESGLYVDIEKAVEGVISRQSEAPYFFTPEEITGWYEAPDFTYDDIDFNTASASEFQGLLDGLALNHAEYLNPTLLGKDASGLHDIYQYNLKEPVAEASELTKSRPKILIVAGLHGSEKASVISMYYFMRDICENWHTNPLLEYLRFNVELILIPFANPWGFENLTYGNSNGVNLNRNFEPYWREGEVGSQYGGTAPLSEPEAQYVAQMIDDNLDAVYFGDYHTLGGSGHNYHLIHHALNPGKYHTEEIDIAAQYHLGKISREFIKRYGVDPNEGSASSGPGLYGTVGYSIGSAFAKAQAAEKGIPASTFECFNKFPDDVKNHNPRSLKACTEIVGSWIITVLKQFKQSNNPKLKI